MNKDYVKLELDKILHMLSEQAYSEICRRKIGEIVPFIGIDKIREESEKTYDAFKMAAKLGTPRFSDIKEPGESLKRANQGGSLSLRELLDIAALLREINILISWNSQYKEGNSLSYIFSRLIPNKELLQRIDTAIISVDEIADNASAELFRIRRSLERQSLLIRERLDKLIRTSDTKKFLQENIVTQRDGRFVIPVKVEHKSEIPGLVHDTSGSGATLFVEPMGVVEANNEIRLLKSREKDEIDRIIAELSALCGDFADELICGFDACIKLEICFAKANLGAKMKGIIPEIVKEPVLDLRNARHPLITPQETVVPVSLNVGESCTGLIVTGPNTGGKTVAIKTAGLLTLMARCGLMIPAADGSRIGIFSEIYADIGDEQSIEQSLSTFSSHMTNIVRIINSQNAVESQNSRNSALVLLDELGSGTDPSEGGALAVAILDYLKEKGCIVIATTHYQEVKIYAIETPGVENASCEFDIATLRPTYRLITGAPGKSNALAIAKRLGLGDDVIERAKNLVSTEDKRFDDIIAALEDSRREADALKEEIAHNERESRALTVKLEDERKAIAAFREKEMANARQRALSIIEGVRQSADSLLDELEDLKRSKDKEDFSARVRGMRSRVNSELDKLHDSANPVEFFEEQGDSESVASVDRALKLYDTVMLLDINKRGSVVSLPDSKGNCFVQVGVMKTKTNVKNLRLVNVKAEERVLFNGKPINKNAHVIPQSASSDISSHRGMELDIRGMASDEGISAVGMFIDSSIMNHIHGVTVIHGKGTGVLRQAVHRYLKGHKQVKEFRLGKYGEGEDGVTVVTLKG
ncbi:MAG: endonuclease MutS2 [Oscillospiraceae bacterium]|nr:endonuclease MutS2 [Oscillospiraceae bacterium]